MGTMSEQWLVHSVLAGGVLLLAGVGLMLWTRQPARRQRIGELAVVSSLLVAVLCLWSGWLPVAIPLWAPPGGGAGAALAVADIPESSELFEIV